MGNIGTDQSAGLPEDIVESVFPIAFCGKYIGPACCGKMILANNDGVVIGACPDHSPIHVSGYGEIIRYRGQPDG